MFKIFLCNVILQTFPWLSIHNNVSIDLGLCLTSIRHIHRHCLGLWSFYYGLIFCKISFSSFDLDIMRKATGMWNWWACLYLKYVYQSLMAFGQFSLLRDSANSYCLLKWPCVIQFMITTLSNYNYPLMDNTINNECWELFRVSTQ